MLLMSPHERLLTLIHTAMPEALVQYVACSVSPAIVTFDILIEVCDAFDDLQALQSANCNAISKC